MNTSSLFELILLFIVPFLAILVPVVIGQRFGFHRRKNLTDVEHTPIGSVVAAAFGLLAFMLAFTFQIAADRYESRKELLLEEVTNIRTTYLRAGLVPEPIRSDSKKLLVEYVDLRVESVKDRSKLEFAINRSQQILDILWSHAETLAQQDNSSEIYALFTSSINDIVNNYNQRITVGLEYRIPADVIWVLFIITFISMLVLGYQFGISGKKGLGINFLLALIFAIVIFLILTLDRPETGITKLNQQPLYKLQQQLK